MRIKTYETEKEFKDALDDYLLTGFSIEDEKKDMVTLVKMNISKVIMHIILIFVCWVIGSFFLGIFFGISSAPLWGVLFFEVLLILVLIGVNLPYLLKAYKGEKVIIKLKDVGLV